MRIENQSTTRRVNNKKINKASSSEYSKGFASILDNLGADYADESENVSRINSINPMLACQEITDSPEQQQQAYEHAETLIDVLEKIKMTILQGKFTLGQLENIEIMVKNQRRPNIYDPKLNEILDDIELRVAVEIAKIEKAAENE